MNTTTNSEDSGTDAPMQATKDALRWLKSALACEAFQWDGDQHEYATAALEAALVEVESARKGAPAFPILPQQPLGAESERVLVDNLEELYSRDGASVALGGDEAETIERNPKSLAAWRRCAEREYELMRDLALVAADEGYAPRDRLQRIIARVDQHSLGGKDWKPHVVRIAANVEPSTPSIELEKESSAAPSIEFRADAINKLAHLVGWVSLRHPDLDLLKQAQDAMTTLRNSGVREDGNG